MKQFFDTSVIVAASVDSHEHHGAALAALQGVASGRHEGAIAAHSLAEAYSVLTRLPVSPRITPASAAKILDENVINRFQIESLDPREYAALVRKCAANGITGGSICDALLLACAEKSQAGRIYTFNVADFRRLAPQLEKLIAAP